MSVNAVLLAPTRAPLSHHQAGAASAHYARDLLRSIGIAFQAQARGMSFESALDARGANEAMKITRALVGALARAAQAPAMTNVPGWAQELVPTVVAAFVDVLAEQGSTLALLPAQRYVFGPGKLRVPMRTSGTSPNLAAAFFAEGGPIRVGALQLQPATLAPKTLGVIGTTTLEMIAAAGDDVMLNVVRQGAMTDSAKALDRIFYDDQPADNKRPAGLQSGIATGDTAVSSGATAANIRADLKGMLSRLIANGFGSPRTVWIMNTLNAAALAEISDEAAMLDRYLKIPIVSGPDVPADVVFLADCAGVAIGQDVPTIDVATETLLHEEAGAGLVSPIVSGDAGAGVMASPTRSIFQTNAAALKLVLPVDWVAADGAVQALTGVAW